MTGKRSAFIFTNITLTAYFAGRKLVRKLSFKTLVLIGLIIFLVPTAMVFAAYNAGDVIGQRSGNLANYSSPYVYNQITANTPYGVALDTANHRLFVSDLWGHRILVYTLDSNNHKISNDADYVIGQAKFSDRGHSATQSTFYIPLGLRYDDVNDRLFAIDHNNSRILVFNTSSISNGMNASNVIGQTNFTNSGNSTTQGTMKYPYSVALDAAGERLFVTDTENNRVLVFDTSSISNGMNPSNVIGQADFTSSTNSTTQTGLNKPIGVEYDAVSDRLFVSDRSNRVLVYDASSISDGMSANNVLGQSDFTSSTAATTQSGLSAPDSMVFDTARNLLTVSDGTNRRVLVYDTSSISNGMNASYVLGQADFTSSVVSSAISGMNGPQGLTYDAVNQQFIINDYGNGRVLWFNATTLSNGSSATYILGGVNANGFNFPVGSAIDTLNHKLYIGECGNRVLVFNLDADNNLEDYTADYVLGQQSFSDDIAATTQSGMHCVWGLALDKTGQRLFVSDYYGYRILVFDTSNLSNGMNASYVIGQTDFTSATYGTTQANFYGAYGVSYDSSQDYLYVADYGNSRVLVFDTSSISNGMNASYVLGQADFTSGGYGTTQSTMSYPSGVAVDEVGQRLFVSDYYNRRALVFDTSSISNGMNASYVLGQPDFTSSSAAITQSGASYTNGVDYNAENNRLYVLDTWYNNRILIYDASNLSNGMNAVAVLGQPDFTSSSSGITQSSINYPEIGISVDTGNNRIYVTDSSNNRVLIYDFVNIATASALSGGTTGMSYSTSLTTTNDQGAVTYALVSGSLPAGLSLDAITGQISGTPTSATTASFSIRATDTLSVGNFVSPAKSFSLTITSPSGGGLPASAFTPIQTPQQGFAVSINGGASTTSTSRVELSFTAGPNTTQMAVSNDPNLQGAGIEPFASTKAWNLESGPGTKTAYVKFYNSWGQPSPVVSASITIDLNSKETKPVLNSSTIPSQLLLDKGTVYLVLHNQKYGFATEKAFLGLGYSFKNVVFGDASKITDSNQIITTSDIPHFPGSWILENKTVYHVTSVGLIPIPTWEIFLGNGGVVNFLVRANILDLNRPKLDLMILNDQRLAG